LENGVAVEPVPESALACLPAETLTAQLLFNKPENPRQFLIKYLENVKVSKAQPLLTANDLSTMFAM
jgi:hypothetical protein